MRIGYTFIILYIIMVLSAIVLSCAILPSKAKRGLVVVKETFPELPEAKSKDGANVFVFGKR